MKIIPERIERREMGYIVESARNLGAQLRGEGFSPSLIQDELEEFKKMEKSKGKVDLERFNKVKSEIAAIAKQQELPELERVLSIADEIRNKKNFILFFRAVSIYASLPSKEEMKTLINQGGRFLVETAKELGTQLLHGDLTSSQIRNIFGEVRRIQMSQSFKDKLILLKPKLAYAAARADELGAYLFRDVMTMAIDEVGDSEEKFQRFVDFFEAILAYHRAAGGR